MIREEGGLPGPIRYLGNYACQEGMAEKPVLKEIRAPDGTVLGTFEYDSQDRVIGMLDADGNRVLYGYDLPNHTQTVTDRRDNPTGYEYDNRGNVTKKTDADGNVTGWAFSSFQRSAWERAIPTLLRRVTGRRALERSSRMAVGTKNPVFKTAGVYYLVYQADKIFMPKPVKNPALSWNPF
ncbi:hypothetical protein DENIS_3117 [Desulfonema ishimotonii]|uniref:Uncharacterized protein n=1 Tax=Desulfonema ishimotonii TaxID=45657 RepID=A0A401FYW3_9BACT|nr:RHS repeat protein [Desulfonema ishimotonii]GBC62154.1 hypothetical protein DENIS_3117 [Desulfonema ishimotonii]